VKEEEKIGGEKKGGGWGEIGSEVREIGGG
jgi:hypothetical protein